MKKIIIIGAGPGGLTSAMILSKRGFDVTIFEKANQVGGRNAKINLENKFTFDTGPTFLMMDFILKEMFKEANEDVTKYLTFKKIEPMYRLNFDDLSVDIKTDLEEMKKEINEKFSDNASGISRFYEKEGDRYNKLFPCLQKDYNHFYSFFNSSFIRAIPILGIGKSLFSNLGNYFKNEKLRLCFTFQSKYLGMSPWECPAGFTIIPFIEHQFGIYHVMGGLHKISEAMSKIIIKNGGKINLNSKVKSLILENKKVRGVELENGEKYYGDEIIINADFAYAMSNLTQQKLKKYSLTNLEKKEYSCSTFMIYLGLKKLYNLPHHNIYFAKDYKKNVAEIFKIKILSQDMSIYIQNPSITDKSLAPSGKSALYILVPIANNFSKINWNKIKNEYKELILNTIIERTGLTDLKDNIEIEKIITPLDWEKEYNVFKGATFNLSHKLSQMLYFRPHNKFEELENCYLVGGGTHPGSGLPTIYESARISANLISKKYNKK